MKCVYHLLLKNKLLNLIISNYFFIRIIIDLTKIQKIKINKHKFK